MFFACLGLSLYSFCRSKNADVGVWFSSLVQKCSLIFGAIENFRWNTALDSYTSTTLELKSAPSLTYLRTKEIYIQSIEENVSCEQGN